MSKYYLAGPMSGIPQSNFPAFDAAAQYLRLRGLDIVSPAELDEPETRELVMNNQPVPQSWGTFLARDVKIVADEVDGVIFLQNWEKSRGARLEAFVAISAGKKAYGLYGNASWENRVRWVNSQHIIEKLIPNIVLP